MARILVIDDDASLLQMMTIILKRGGHETLVSADAEEGIAMARQHRPDMAIVDVMMPMINGYQVCYTLRTDEATRDMPLLILTALTEAEHRERAEDAGADGFVTKPIASTDLLKQVADLLATGARNRPQV
jgi:CheY-like chemotaxis protein